MPVPPPEVLIFEPFVETDEIKFLSQLSAGNNHDLLWEGNSRWVEITVGVLGKQGCMWSMTPSITVKETGDILSLEEKFQGTLLQTGWHASFLCCKLCFFFICALNFCFL